MPDHAITSPIPIDSLPCPPALPLLGNLLDLRSPELHRVMEGWIDRYGPVFRFKMGAKSVLVVSSPETLHFVLRNRPDLFRRMGRMDEMIREIGVLGVFNAEGAEWKAQRKSVSQALNAQHLRTFFPRLTEITRRLLARWQRLSAESAAIDITSELMRYTVDVTSRLAFGYHMNTIEQEDAIQAHLEVIFPALYRRINAALPYWRYINLPADRKLNKSLRAVNDLMQGIIAETRTRLADQPSLKLHPENFLQALLSGTPGSEPVSDEVLVGNVLTMLLAGEDTTAHSLAWVFYYMHRYPEVQLLMQEEADRVLGEADVITRYDDCTRLPYIEAVALEAMRLKPVSPFMFHEALADVVVEGVLVTKGTGIVLQTQHAPLQDEHFSEPRSFLPGRWINSGCPALAAHNEKAYTPFGGGARFCPGYGLAMLEIKAVLAMVCRHFTVIMETPPENVREVLAFTMRPSHFLIRLEKRSEGIA